MLELSKSLYQKIRNPFISFCVNHSITANRLSILNHFITLTFGAYFFATAQWLPALIICLINGFLDYLDGDVARARDEASELGEWLDTGFDVIVQNAILGAIALGCYSIGLPVYWVVLFFIGNSANNFVSFFYNQKFGFTSLNGNELFRKIMDRKCHPITQIIKNIIDPTGSHVSLAFYTYRYWILFGCLLNLMPFVFICMTIINNAKWIVMFTTYALYLQGEDRLFVLKALSALDEERDDFYQLRSSRPV